MHKKQFYEAPDAELLVVNFEKSFCESEFKATSWSSGQTNWFEDDDE